MVSLLYDDEHRLSIHHDKVQDFFLKSPAQEMSPAKYEGPAAGCRHVRIDARV